MRPMEHSGESALVARAKKGDMEAFETLVKMHRMAIYALCFRMTGAHQTADDIAQETFVKAYFALDGFDSSLPLFPWLRRIAVNSGLNHLKSRKREEPLGDRNSAAFDPAFSSSSPSPLDELQRNETGKKVERALKALPVKLKTVFVLHTYEDLSYEEIARALGIPRGTVMSRLNRARLRLRAAFSEGMPGGKR